MNKMREQQYPTLEDLEDECDRVHGDCIYCQYKLCCPDSEIKDGMGYEE